MAVREGDHSRHSALQGLDTVLSLPKNRGGFKHKTRDNRNGSAIFKIINDHRDSRCFSKLHHSYFMPVNLSLAARFLLQYESSLRQFKDYSTHHGF